MNSVVMSIRGLPSLELWVLTLPVVSVPVGTRWFWEVPVVPVVPAIPKL